MNGLPPLVPQRHCGACGGRLGPLEGPRQICTSCGAHHYHAAAPCAAVLVEDAVGAVLLGRRAIEPAYGLWDLPGGFCEPDETPEQAAVRELLEETGCRIAITGFLGHLIDFYGADGRRTLNALFTARIVEGSPRAADDVAELRFFALDALPSRDELAFENTAQALGLLRDRSDR